MPDRSGPVSQTIILTVWYPYCALCDNQLPDDPRDRVQRSCRSEEGALRELAFHRSEHHIAPWYSDPPACEGCGKSGPIQATRTVRTAPHVDIRMERDEDGQVVRVDRSEWQTTTEPVTERLERDENVPWPLPDRWWHSSCHRAYLADPERESEIDDRYDDRIKAERKWAEEVAALIDATEGEGVLWGVDWKARNALGRPG